MSRLNDFKARLKESAPASHYETEEYKNFNQPFVLIGCITMIVAAYASLWLFESRFNGTSELLSRIFPLLEPRIRFLKTADGYSHLAYTATVVSGLFLAPLVIVVFGVGYWTTVVVPRKCRPFKQETAVIMVFLALAFATLATICFVEVPAIYHPGRPGMSRFFFWPLFPAFGAAVIFLCAGAIFSILVGILKLVFLRGGHNG